MIGDERMGNTQQCPWVSQKLLFEDEIQRVGDAAGLKGRFLVDFGTDQIIDILKRNNLDIERAVEMLNIAAKYIRQHFPDGMIHYDETECDGYCVADDCEIAAEALKESD